MLPVPEQRWHSQAVELLRAAYHVTVAGAPAEPPKRRSPFAWMYAHLDAWPDPDAGVTGGYPPAPADGYELIVDFTGGSGRSEPASVPVLRPMPARLAEADILPALLRRETTLSLAVQLELPGKSAAVAEAATVALSRHSARRSAARASARLGALLVRAVGRVLDYEALPQSEPMASPGRPTPGSAVRFLGFAARSAAKVALTRVDWEVRYGESSSPDPFDLPTTLRSVAAPSGHFYADPFAVARDGRSFVFLEDYDFRLARASIAVVDLMTHAATTVLTADHHLSYPFVFSAGGEWYMLPESAAAGEIRLFKCDEFPDRWCPDALLLGGVEAYDPTLLHLDGLWWLFFASGTPGAAADDELHVWFSPSLRGPYQPHRRNPVVSSVAGARPAGRISVDDGKVLRPAQDGSREYGGAIVIQHVQRLSVDDYEERAVRRIEPAQLSATGIHTLTRADGLVAVDAKFRVLRRPRSRH